jgi:hypothetical protein
MAGGDGQPQQAQERVAALPEADVVAGAHVPHPGQQGQDQQQEEEPAQREPRQPAVPGLAPQGPGGEQRGELDGQAHAAGAVHRVGPVEQAGEQRAQAGHRHPQAREGRDPATAAGVLQGVGEAAPAAIPARPARIMPMLKISGLARPWARPAR